MHDYHYHVSAKHWWSVPRFEAQPSQLASHDATWARVRERTPSLASRGGPHDSRLTAHSPKGRARSRCASRQPAGRAGRAPPRSPSALASHPAGARCSSTTSVPGGTSPRATSGSSSSPPSRSRYASGAFTAHPVRAPRPSLPVSSPSSRGSRPNRFCLGSRPRDAHFEIPPTTVTTPPSSRRPRSSSSSPRTSPRHAPPSPVRAPGASPSAPVPATPTACSTRRTSKAQTRRAA